MDRGCEVRDPFLFHVIENERVCVAGATEADLEFSIATAYAVTPEVLIGGEVRHLSGGEDSLF
jgi:hypothetical protein